MKSIINGVISENENINNWKLKGYVYEVLRVVDNKPLFLTEHLLRLKNSISGIDIISIEKNMKMLINSIENDLNDNIFISVKTNNNEAGIFIIKGFYPPKEWYKNGIKINTFKIKRRDPNKKVYDVNYKERIEEHLKKTNVFETLITDEGVINEGSKSNVFFIRDGVIFTPPVAAVLPGITRDKVFEAARKSEIKITEISISINGLSSYDGAFITGTSIDLLPIRQIDEIKYKTTELDIFKKLFSCFEKIKNKDLVITNNE